LEILVLHSNLLAGGIPSELGSLSRLQELDLHSNQLSGSIPAALGKLSSLGLLSLHSNQLTGNIPAKLGDLSNLVFLYLNSNQMSGELPGDMEKLTGLNCSQYPCLEIGYNAFWTDDVGLRAFLNSKDPDWDETQTIAPEGVTVVSVTDRTVWIEWTPIVYTADFGGYEVFGKQATRTADSGGYTLNKLGFTFPVTALQPGQAYDFTVDTFTRSHALNQNTVVSEMTEPVTATTTNTGCAAPNVTVSGDSAPFTLTVTSTHDTYEWVTGETTSSIMVSPNFPSWYWVRTTGPGSCEEAAVVLVQSVLFGDGFESGDLGAWSDF